MKIDLNKQEIEFNRSMRDELEACYEVEGKVKNRYESSRGFGNIYDSFFHPEKAGTKECLFKLKISAKGGDIISYNFEDIEPSHGTVVDVPTLRKSVMDELDSTDDFIRGMAETDLIREITEDIRDRR